MAGWAPSGRANRKLQHVIHIRSVIQDGVSYLLILECTGARRQLPIDDTVAQISAAESVEQMQMNLVAFEMHLEEI